MTGDSEHVRRAEPPAGTGSPGASRATGAPEPAGAGRAEGGRSPGEIEVVRTEVAPTPTGPFNQAVASRGLVFTAGQAGRNRETGQMGDAAEQVDWALRNLDAILRAAGSSLATALKLTLYVRDDVTDMAPLNAAYRGHFPGELPARSTVFVRRLKGPDMLVEIEAVGVAG